MLSPWFHGRRNISAPQPVRRAPRCVALIAAMCLLLPARWLPAEEAQLAERPHRRQPVQLVGLDGGKLLLAVNRRAGSLSLIDPLQRQVLSEQRLGDRLSAVAVDDERQLLFALDEGAHRLIIAQRREGRFQELAALPVPHTPVSITLTEDCRTALVASLWARQLTIVDLAIPRQPRIAHTVSLPFAPRHQCLLPKDAHNESGERLILADAFRGSLGVIDLATPRLLHVHAVEGHNLAGLTLSPDHADLVIPHQVLDSTEPTTNFNVHWGQVLRNVVTTLPVARLLEKPNGEPLAGVLDFVGYRDEAAGDPTAITFTGPRRRLIAFAGTGEVAASVDGVNYLDRLTTGGRPTAIWLEPQRPFAWVADTFGDRLAIVSTDALRMVAEVSLGPTPPLTPVERGERLFYDSRLSSHGWYSCHSCHPDGHTSGGLNDNGSDDSYGAPKRVISLLGTADTGPWAWNGQIARLETQIGNSLKITMQTEDPPSDETIADLTRYVRSLAPPPSIRAARGELRPAAIARGKRLFQQTGCADCHAGSSYTSAEVYDVGLVDEQGLRKFNPPSLRGVSQRGPLFHDGRATGLRDAMLRHRHGQSEPLDQDAAEDLLEFLESL